MKLYVLTRSGALLHVERKRGLTILGNAMTMCGHRVSERLNDRQTEQALRMGAVCDLCRRKERAS